MTIHSSILDWKIPWTEEPGRLWFMESQRVGHDLLTENNNTHMSIPYCLDYVALKIFGFHFLKITKKKGHYMYSTKLVISKNYTHGRT